MKLFLQIFLLCLAVLLTGSSCSNPNIVLSTPGVVTNASTGLILIQEMGSLSVWAAQADQQTAKDILADIQTNSKQICAELQTECRFPVKIEIYPDQASFDEHVMNPEMRGFFAISGSPHTIQMVSPANPAPHQISYEDGVSVAIHEFVHLVLNEMNTELPTWLEEGTAIDLAPHQLYSRVCEQAFPFERVPSLQQMEVEYEQVPAADLFAYTMVDFIVSEYGMEKLDTLLRTPQDLEKILGLSKEKFQEHWLRFIQTQYHNQQTKVPFEQ